jgi:hypothetical protein
MHLRHAVEDDEAIGQELLGHRPERRSIGRRDPGRLRQRIETRIPRDRVRQPIRGRRDPRFGEQGFGREPAFVIIAEPDREVPRAHPLRRHDGEIGGQRIGIENPLLGPPVDTGRRHTALAQPQRVERRGAAGIIAKEDGGVRSLDDIDAAHGWKPGGDGRSIIHPRGCAGPGGKRGLDPTNEFLTEEFTAGIA